MAQTVQGKNSSETAYSGQVPLQTFGYRCLALRYNKERYNICLRTLQH